MNDVEEQIATALKHAIRLFWHASKLLDQTQAEPNGVMGVYLSQDYGYIHLFMLVDAQKRVYYKQQYLPRTPHAIPLEDTEDTDSYGKSRFRLSRCHAEIIAAFAGAQEVPNDVSN